MTFGLGPYNPASEVLVDRRCRCLFLKDRTLQPLGAQAEPPGVTVMWYVIASVKVFPLSLIGAPPPNSNR